mgnify:FL=1
MDYGRLAVIIVKKLDKLAVIEVGTPFNDRHVEVIEELRDLIDIFTNSWTD